MGKCNVSYCGVYTVYVKLVEVGVLEAFVWDSYWTIVEYAIGLYFVVVKQLSAFE